MRTERYSVLLCLLWRGLAGVCSGKPSKGCTSLESSKGQAESDARGECAWLESEHFEACIGAFDGPEGGAYAELHLQIEECLVQKGSSGCPQGTASHCRSVHVPDDGKGAKVCAPACAQSYASLIPFLLPKEDPDSFSSLLDQSSPKAAQARTVAAMLIACNPNAVVPLATPGPVRPACRAATTRAACAAAAGPLGLVEYGRNAPPIPYSKPIPDESTDPDEGAAEHDDADHEKAEEVVAPKLRPEEVGVRSACAREERALCEWLRPFEVDEGTCVADVAGADRVGWRRQREVDIEVAECMADNGYIEGTQLLSGCQKGHTFCMSVALEDSPGSYACMHASVVDPAEHQLWFYYYLTCSGPVSASWEAFCSLARGRFYGNLGCPECAAAAEAAAPHQALCASATTELACDQLNVSLHA